MNFFVFQWPWLLLLILGLLPLCFLLQQARCKRNEVILQLGGSINEYRWRKDLMRLVALLLFILALARPGIAPKRLSVINSGRDVVFVLDVSQSMLAEDAMPSRLEAAKQGVRDALESFTADRVGLVAYAGSANILCPLTQDYDFVRYMLEQATPRSVDFGGTQLISAIQKSVDQVFTKGREGFQDIVLVTDGEDHVEKFAEIANLLMQAEAGLLILGVGDAEYGARIPIVRDDGSNNWLQYKGSVVETKLNRTSLEKLNQAYKDSIYVEAGTLPFDLGSIYNEFALNRPVGGSNSEGDTVLIYQELAFFFLLLGMALFLCAEFEMQVLLRKVKGTLPLWLFLFFINNAYAKEGAFVEAFEKALALQHESKYEKAVQHYDEIFQNYPQVSSEHRAVLQFNIGLARLALAKEAEQQSARMALMEAQLAQRSFLGASRLFPDLVRAGQRLDEVAQFILDYEKKIEQEAQEEDELQAEIQKLLSNLEQLVESHKQLYEEIPDLSANNKRHKKKKKHQSPESQAKPDPRTLLPDEAIIHQWPIKQNELSEEGRTIRERMSELDQLMTPEAAGMPSLESILAKPLELMTQAVETQNKVPPFLSNNKEWPLARREMRRAIDLMEQILRIMSNSDSSDSMDSDEMMDMEEEDWEMYDESDYEENPSSNMQGKGDLAQGSEMQPLPKPNYTAEEILHEETENQQFREQKRSKANEGKVDKDW
ncbi:MAG: VWA domain-containing protein [Verrucomicrobiota bacterium]